MNPILLALILFALAAAVLIYAVRYRRAAGSRRVECPENQQAVQVQVNAARAALTGSGGLRLNECTRWPEKADCGQECLSQIHSAADGCKVRSMLESWYAQKLCVGCGKTLGAIKWFDHQPALVTPDRHVLQWSQVDVESLPSILESHEPLCWDCSVVQKVYEKRPDLVVDRPKKWQGDEG